MQTFLVLINYNITIVIKIITFELVITSKILFKLLINFK